MDYNKYANLNMTKLVDKKYSDVYTTLTYYIPIENLGNVTASSILFIDTIPTNTTFISNSFTQDGITIPGSPAPPGITLNNIGPGILSTVSFQVVVVTLPSTSLISNSATCRFSYVINPSQIPNLTRLGYTTSNIVTTTILNARLLSRNHVNTLYVTIGNVVTYTITLTNNGNTTANNIFFSDTLPCGSTLVPGTFTQNGTVILGSPEPPGISLFPIAPGSTTTVAFQVTVSSLPSTNSMKNSATTTFDYLYDPSIIPNLITTNSSNTNITTTTVSIATFATMTLTSNISYATCNDVVTFIVTLPNTGNSTAYNVRLYDTIPIGLTFIDNSVTINGITIPCASPKAPTGILVGNIPSRSTYVIKYKCSINC